MTNELLNSQPHIPMEKSVFQPKYAGFWVRLWAFLIDLLLVTSISGIFVKPIFRLLDVAISKPFAFLFSPYKVAALLLLLLYFILMTKWAGQTVGKMILGIRVVKLNGQKLDWSTVLFREGIGRFISQMLWIPYLLVLFTPQKSALHDLFADTTVIHERVYEKKIVQKQNSTEQHQLQEDPTV
ncbi:RDD family protein [Sporosarcina obsidiansis]|uniref:RDD family protein n=1 Tax=Sporosarcina obsidiansis TaxID=2660748 RepID=UPI001E5EBB30|nr:RDD family protein [Sporosarcina obsidiansis]